LSQWYDRQRKHMERISKFPNNVSHPKVCSLLHRRVMEKTLSEPRQYAYLLIEVEDKRASNLVIELYADMCPFTVKNFQRLCTNTKSTGCDCRTYRLRLCFKIAYEIFFLTYLLTSVSRVCECVHSSNFSLITNN